MVSNPAFWGGTDDGGGKAAANAQATLPVTAALGNKIGQGVAAGAAALPKKPASKLQVKPPPNPFAARTSKQTVGYG